MSAEPISTRIARLRGCEPVSDGEWWIELGRDSGGLRRHKWQVFGPYADGWGRRWRNHNCGACGLWRRAKVHR